MMRRMLLLIALLSPLVFAHQPVMDMAPRWNNGYGIQTRVESANDKTTTWIEGVYTFKPAIRMTLKIPIVDEKLDDVIFALPLKHYKNAGAFTSNLGITPSVRIPTGGGHDWDAGLSVSYSSEQPHVYQFYDLFRLGDQTGLDINVAKVFRDSRGSSTYWMWDITARDSNSGRHLLSGPVFVYFKGSVIFRAEYKANIYDKDDEWDGDFINVGIGKVF